MSKIVNPVTGRMITVGGPTHRKLMRQQQWQHGGGDGMNMQNWQIYARIQPNLDFMGPDRYDAYFSQCLGSVLDYALELGTSSRSSIVEIWFGNLATLPSEEVMEAVRQCVSQLGEVTDFLAEEQIEPEDDY